MNTEQLKKKPYLYFAFKLLLFVILLAVLDFGIGSILRHFYFKQEAGRQARATYAFDKTTADILVFGSSRAYHHYVPSVLEENFNQTTYNAGSPGQFILYDYAALTTILNRYKPKTIILDVNIAEFKNEHKSYEALSFLLPYYKEHKEIRPIIELKAPFEKVKNLSSIYPFNSAILMIAGGNSNYIKKRNIDLNGYKPLDRVLDEPIKDYDFHSYSFDSTKIALYKSFIAQCKSAGIELYIICSPSYQKFASIDSSIATSKKIAIENKICFFDFSYDTTYTRHGELFDDPTHLNRKGSELFTQHVADSIKSCMAQKSVAGVN